MNIRRAMHDDRVPLAQLAASLQRRSDRHIAYLSVDAPTIAEEMVAEDDDWTAVSAVAARGDRTVGWLMGSVDADMGRVWWFGPFVDVPTDDDWPIVADALYGFASDLLPFSVDEEEMGPDEGFGALIDWATSIGFHRDPGSAVLTFDGAAEPASIPIRPAQPDDVATVGALHDQLFPATHTPGNALVRGGDADHLRLVTERDGSLIGYVAVERQPDGNGYIDFLGVAPEHRRHGYGVELVRAGIAALADLGCTRCSLTVREDNVAARALYARLGFTEERIIVPLRRGFSTP